MEIELYKRRREQGMLGIALVLFKRLVALFLLFFALTYWARITGVWPGGDMRFDTMPEHWRIAAPVMAVLLPVSAIGLWGQFSWGTISWLMTIAAALLMYWGMPHLFGNEPQLIAFHLFSLAIYFVLKGVGRFLGVPGRLLPRKE